LLVEFIILEKEIDMEQTTTSSTASYYSYNTNSSDIRQWLYGTAKYPYREDVIKEAPENHQKSIDGCPVVKSMEIKVG